MPTTRVGFDDGGGISGRDALIRYGPTLYVQIGFDPTYRPAETTRPNLSDIRLPALVDTGALESCIDSALASKLGLPIVDQGAIADVHGASTVNVHLAQIYVPDLDSTVYGRFSGVHLSEGGQPHSALIGRTFLQNVTMVYEGRTGTVTISND